MVQSNCIDFKYAIEILKNECSNREVFVVMEPIKYLNYEDEKINHKDYFKRDIDHLPNHEVDMISIKNAEGMNL